MTPRATNAGVVSTRRERTRTMPQYIKFTPEQRIAAFWAKVDRSGGDDACWLWTGALVRKGYGNMFWDGRSRTASRISYELAYGAFDESLLVCHACDNPGCVNPKHLFLGTDKDNFDDMIRKGRGRFLRGSAIGTAKLTDEKVVEIRERYAAGGITMQELGAEYGVVKQLVSGIVRRKYWRHVP